ncbi:uncharacterized protein C8R40DRAFT_492363 [Lentinula edodes]|uniref:uncharacterized protein n=1 Tax=Lentinula edodes TaxID=5353 RepID=UPI001E8D04AE|nr:uncharacterized protein C8R40DRAFT_492363 [Lentinula edodes]KAH7872261.1 hypothetical protein C8R40DRAFT_492363 [Lentinula edodes]
MSSSLAFQAPRGFTAMLSLEIIALVLQACVFASPLAGPTVTLDSAVVTGVTSGNTQEFLGIPFAQPPYDDFIPLL